MLVSCLMPTYNRRKFLRTAIACFQSQDWPEKELIVVDDGTDKVEDVFEGVSDCRYFRFAETGLPQHRPHSPIGTKLNFGCEQAKGEVIVRWDDDDWSAPGRITDQVTRLLESGKAVSGYHSMLFWNQEAKQASKYQGQKLYSLGSALCYRKDFWHSHKFLSTSVGEDSSFVQMASPDKIISVDAGQFMVARIHLDNTSNRHGPLKWPAVDISALPATFFQAIEA